MKTKLFILPVIYFLGSVIICSCQNSTEDIESVLTNETKTHSDLEIIRTAFENQNFTSVSEAANFAKETLIGINSVTRALNDDEYLYEMSSEAAAVIDEMKNITVDTDSSPENLRAQLKEVIYFSKLNKESNEYYILLESVDIAMEVIYYAMHLEQSEAVTRGFWSDAWSVVKCVAGTAGSAGTGALAGAGIGTVTVPVIGTVSGTALGAWSGGLVGLATFC